MVGSTEQIKAELESNTILFVATILVSTLTVATQFATLLALPPLFTDAASATGLLLVGVIWFRVARRTMPKRRRFLNWRVWVALAILCIGCFMMAPVATHLVRSRWLLCGQFFGVCSHDACIQLFDSRGRPLGVPCQNFDDDSGLIRLQAPTWWTYQPATAAASCEGQISHVVVLDRTFFNHSCAGAKDLR